MKRSVTPLCTKDCTGWPLRLFNSLTWWVYDSHSPKKTDSEVKREWNVLNFHLQDASELPLRRCPGQCAFHSQSAPLCNVTHCR